MSDRQLNIADEQDEQDELDALEALMDRALASYTPARPRLGLEDRVLARLNATASSARGRERIPMLWVWASLTALAALLLVGLTLRPHARPVPANLATVPSGPSIPSIPITQNPDRHPAIALAHSSSKPRASRTQPSLPTPSGPSQQQLIAQLMANGPEAIASLARDDDKLDKPITIQFLPDDPLVTEPIKITPIDDNPAESGGSF
jgi:hypothetical protein